MEFTFTNEINLLDIIGLVGWAIGILVGASWLKRRYANRLESDPMRIFQSNITDLETIARMMENSETRYFAREHDDSEDAVASAKIADVMADWQNSRDDLQRLVDLLPRCESAQFKALSPRQACAWPICC